MHAVLAEGEACVRRSDEARDQMGLVGLDVGFEHGGDARAVLFLHESQMQGEDQGCLGLAYQASGGCHVLGAKRGQYLFAELPVPDPVLFPSQQLRRIGENLKAPQITGVGREVILRGAFAGLI